MFAYRIFDALSIFLNICSWAILIYCILTWVAPRSSLRYWLEKFIYPFCAPFQRLSNYIRMRWGSPFDFTCWFALIGIRILQRLLWEIFFRLFY
ncbi:MAG: YggT family protein [Clostridia bacterium]|nr:YggT family protein [Clostridia bacterium]